MVVTTLPGGAIWSISVPAEDSWPAVTSGVQGVGSGSVQLSVTPNTAGVARLSHVTAGTSTLAVFQDANPAAAATQVKLDRTNVTMGETGGNVSLIVSNAAPAGTVPVADVSGIAITGTPPAKSGIRFPESGT